MPGHFIPRAADNESIHALEREPAVWLDQDGNACMSPDLFNALPPEVQDRLLQRVSQMQAEHAEQVAARKQNETVFIPPRTVVPGSALELAAAKLAQSGVALIAAGNALRAALPNLALDITNTTMELDQ